MAAEHSPTPTLNVSPAAGEQTSEGLRVRKKWRRTDRHQTPANQTPTPTLNVSPAAGEQLSNRVQVGKKQRTVQMTFVDKLVNVTTRSGAEEQMRDLPWDNTDITPNLNPEDNVGSSMEGDEPMYLISDGEDDEDSLAACMAEYETGLEPPHRTTIPSPMADTTGQTQDSDVGSEYEDVTTDKDTHWHRREAEQDLERQPFITKYPGELMAIDGVKERLCLSYKNARELNQMIDTHLPGRPHFQRKEILVGDEVCDLYFRDILQCIRALFLDPDFGPYLKFAPERHYVNEDKDKRVYHDMYTGGWWWFTQVAIEKDLPGATTVPVLLSTDKTQLTPFQDKCAYPIYMTIGNIPKEIHRKASMHAYFLLGYLPMTKLKLETNQAKRKRLTTNLYHACLRHILEPLISAGNHGVFMPTATGDVHRIHPIVVNFIGDYPEQVLSTCTLTGDCPRCGTSTEDLGNFDPNNMPAPRNLDNFLNVLDSFHRDPAGFLQALL
ncbi:hypothetical protein EI94DRAFT_1815535 [Lactarius quietus]|nr:hypothetical protein EI94DRAFT_1815535 [Lactarius quietus]